VFFDLYEPEPAWGCDCVFIPKGDSFVRYTSDSTTGTPPIEAPVTQKEECQVCGGIEYRIVNKRVCACKH